MGLSTSVIITVYNLEKFVAASIESVLSQTVKADEIIVVNDGSSDNSVEEIKKFGDSVKLISFDKNQGVLPALLAGINKATGKVLLFLDGDDIWYPTKIEKVTKAFETNPDIMMVTHLHEWINEKGELTGVIDGCHRNLNKIVSESNGDLTLLDKLLKYSILSYKGVWLGSAMCIRKGVVDWVDYLKWIDSLPGKELSHQDQPLAAYMIYENPEKIIHLINEPLFKYRVFANNSSGKSTDVSSALRTIFRSIATVSRTYDMVKRMPERVEENERQKNTLMHLYFQEDLYKKKYLKAFKNFKYLFLNHWDGNDRSKELYRLLGTVILGPQKFLKLKTKYKFR